MQELIGKRIGNYQIVEQIGRGGMATVFKAYQPSMDRYVAIKILPSHFTEDKSFVGRFTQEARTLARLEHPHILPVHDYGEEDGTTYLVMRYVKAGTLKDLINREGTVPLREVARILAQVGGALDYAHSQDVIHRDIKPSNVLIDDRGNTFLTDFGIAKLVAETAQFTASGAVIGTPAYMAPEQGMGQPVDYRCDIYALGVVLYELVTGRVPYEAETPLAVLLQHVNAPLPMPRQIRPDLPEALERVILKAMAKKPEERFQSAQQLVDALTEAVASKPAEIAGPAPTDEVLERTSAVRSISEPQAPAVDTKPVGAKSPEPMAERAAPEWQAPTPPPVGEKSLPAKVATRRQIERPEAQSPKRTPWLLIAGGAILLMLLLAGGAYVISNLIDGEPTPAVLVATEPATAGASQVQATSAEGGEPAAVGQTAGGAGWTNYGNDNFVLTLALQGDYLWAGSESGLVRWNLGPGSYTRFGKEDGLPSVRVNDLLVDDAGLLWVATDAGIGLHADHHWESYTMEGGLDSNSITALFQDEFGGLWAGSRGGERGLNYFQGARWGTPPPAFLPPLPVEYPNVTVMGGNEEVGYFVGLEDQGLLRFEGDAWLQLTAADGLPGDEVLDASLTSDSLWVSFNEGVARFTVDEERMETLPLEYVHTIHQAADGEMWFGGAYRAVRFDPETGDEEEFDAGDGPIPGWLVTDIVEDERGLYFASYGGGVTFYDGTRWETWLTNAQVGGNLIESIRQDGDGALWFAHPGTGFSRYQPENDTWQVFGEVDGALDWPSVPGIDSAGNLWAGDYGELVYYDGQGWQTFYAPELADVSIDGIEFGPGNLQWIATDAGLMRYDPATDEWMTFTGDDHPLLDDIWCFLVNSDGVLWVGGEQGLVQYDGTTWSIPSASGSTPQFVDDLAEGPDGTLWVAADGELGHLADGRWTYVSWPGDGWIETLAFAPDGSIWAGYEGLGRYDPASDTWQIFTTEDGLVHMTVRAIHVTPDGVVWVGTEGGVSRYVPQR
ncbi:MAG: protein kinase [Anaerolineae bacterium]|jgi:serine/threonine protein kinase/ligand-binding sensor domain-containing protein